MFRNICVAIHNDLKDYFSKFFDLYHDEVSLKHKKY